MKMNKLNQAIMVATGLWSSAILADGGATVLDNVTVSASPIHQHNAFEVPSQIDSISGEEKQANQSGSLGAVVEKIPGVNNQSTGSQSGKPVIRGMTGNRIKVLSNGVATDYQAYGTRHMPNTESYLAERIEVIRGPQGVLYGSNAMGGVVNVIQPTMPYGKKMHGEIAGEYNSNNQEKMVGVKVGAGSDKFAIQAGVAKRDADNFTVPNASTDASAGNTRPVFVGEVPHTNFDNQSANIGMGYQDDWGNIELRHTEWASKQNYLALGPGFVAVPTGQKLGNSETQLKGEVFTDSDWIIKPSISHTRNSREASHDQGYETMASEKGEDHYLDILVKRTDYKLAFEHPKVGDFEGEIGFVSTDKDQVLRSGHLTPSANVDAKGVYLFEEADYDNLLVQFGARYDSHEVKAPLDGGNEHFVVDMGVFDATNNRRSFDVFSGSLGGTYKLNEQWSLAANIATGFRAPTIFELYAGGEHGGVQAFQMGNPNLKAETSLNTDLSLRWQTSKTQMVATVYQNWVDNYIYLANTGAYRCGEACEEAGGTYGATSPTQTTPAWLPEMEARQTNAIVHGLEFNVEHEFNKAWSAEMGLEIIDGTDTKNSTDLALMPANNVRLTGHYRPADGVLKKQRVSLGVKLVDSKKSAGSFEPFSQFDSKPVGRASTDAYAVWNLDYTGQVKLDKQTLKLSASVENLFDTAYVDFLNTYKGYTLNQGRNFKLTARMDF